MKKIIVLAVGTITATCLIGCSTPAEEAKVTPTPTPSAVVEEVAQIIQETTQRLDLANVPEATEIPLQLSEVDLSALIPSLPPLESTATEQPITELSKYAVKSEPVLDEAGNATEATRYFVTLPDNAELKLYQYLSADANGEDVVLYAAYGSIFDTSITGTITPVSGSEGFYPVTVTLSEVAVQSDEPLIFPAISLDTNGNYVNAAGEYVDLKGNVVPEPINSNPTAQAPADPTQTPAPTVKGTSNPPKSGSSSGSSAPPPSNGGSSSGLSGGSSGGSSAPPPSQSTPQPDPNAGKTYHDEVGHYETVVISPEEPIYEKYGVWVCNCGYESEDKAVFLDHIDAHADNNEPCNSSRATRSRQVGTKPG